MINPLASSSSLGLLQESSNVQPLLQMSGQMDISGAIRAPFRTEGACRNIFPQFSQTIAEFGSRYPVVVVFFFILHSHEGASP